MPARGASEDRCRTVLRAVLTHQIEEFQKLRGAQIREIWDLELFTPGTNDLGIIATHVSNPLDLSRRDGVGWKSRRCAGECRCHKRCRNEFLNDRGRSFRYQQWWCQQRLFPIQFEGAC